MSPGLSADQLRNCGQSHLDRAAERLLFWLLPASVSFETVFLAPGVQKQVRVNHTDAIITAFDQSGVHQLPHNPADVSFVQTRCWKPEHADGPAFPDP